MNAPAVLEAPRSVTSKGLSPMCANPSIPKTCSVEGCDRLVSARGWCGMHYARWKRTGDPTIITARFPSRPNRTVEERFWEKVEVSDEGCWNWLAHTADGYGVFWEHKRLVKAHRFSYELHVGPIPNGLELDHLCRNRACVNPDHLEPVTHSVNVLRGIAPLHRLSKTHCPHGHPYSGDNLYISPSNRRYCRTCTRERMRRIRAERKRGAS